MEPLRSVEPLRSIDFLNAQGLAGIDNQLVGVLLSQTSSFFSGLALESRLRAQIASGALLLAIRINDLGAFDHDSSIAVDLFLVDARDCTASPCALRDGRVEADAAWMQREGPAIATGLAGRIEGGELFVAAFDLPLPVDASETLVLRDARLSARISRTELVLGDLGAAVRVEDLLALAETRAPDEGTLVQRLLVMHADLEPSEGDPQACSSVSVGMSWRAVSARMP